VGERPSVTGGGALRAPIGRAHPTRGPLARPDLRRSGGPSALLRAHGVRCRLRGCRAGSQTVRVAGVHFRGGSQVVGALFVPRTQWEGFVGTSHRSRWHPVHPAPPALNLREEDRARTRGLLMHRPSNSRRAAVMTRWQRAFSRLSQASAKAPARVAGVPQAALALRAPPKRRTCEEIV
jgi:hypothetical protein